MAEHDYVIANQNGANTRSDLNNALAAIVSNNSKATAPTTTYAYMWWADTANDILKQRNAADSAWISILTLSTGAPLATIANFTSTGIDDNATSTAITIDSSERVGFSTTSPQALTHIYANDTTAYDATATDGQRGTGATLFIENDANDNLSYSQIALQARTGYEYCRIVATGGSAPDLAFVVNNAESMRIDSSGNVLVGTTSSYSPNYRMSILGGSSGGVIIRNAAATGNAIVFQNSAASTVGLVSTNNTTTTYSTSSDYRLKELDVPMEGSIDRLKLLRPINFAWKVDGSRTDGFLAHEAGEVVPECATGTKDAMRDEEYEVTPAVMDGETVVTEAVMGTRSVPDYQGIDQSKLVPLLVASLQEAIARIEVLEAEMNPQ